MYHMEILLKALGEWLKLLAPVTGGLGLLWKFWLKAKWDEIKLAHKNLQTIVDLKPKIDRIELELKPNGGSSIHDAINRIESKVGLQDQKLLALLKSMPYGTFITDSLGNWIDVNLTLCRITERTESELKGNDWMNWIHEDDKEDVMAEWERAVKNKMVFNMNMIYTTPTGQEISIQIHGNQLKSEKGDLIGYFGTVYNVG